MNHFAGSLHRKIPAVHSRPVTEHKFSAESGLVFAETEVRVNRRKHQDWIRGLSTPDLAKRPRPNASGARSLLEMATIKVATEFLNLDPDHFATISWELSEKVWKVLKSLYDPDTTIR